MSDDRYPRSVTPDPTPWLAGLTEAQAQAVLAVRGPVVIHAGAGTGKTTTIIRRAAWAAASGAVDPRTALLVTFTEKAAAELVARLAEAGITGMTARTVHGAAWAQLRHFWPRRHPDRALPEVLGNPYRIVGRLARRLPGGFAFTPARDLVDEIGWARAHSLGPGTYAAGLDGHEPPIPPDLVARIFRDYEREKRREGVIDFHDMLALTAELLEEDAEARARVHERYAWFSVDEYQDTSADQQRLIDLWVGDRQDLCVVGDLDQTIHTYAGASPAFLAGFTDRYPQAVVADLRENHRSSPEILALANRAIGRGPGRGLVATRPSGPPPSFTAHADETEEIAALTAAVRGHLAAGTPAAEIAVLVRLNAQLLPIELAFREAGIPFRLRGRRFFDRPEIRDALAILGRDGPTGTGEALFTALERLFRERLGYETETVRGAEARERQAALRSLLALSAEALRAEPTRDAAGLVDALRRRAAEEAADPEAETGVTLSTLHRAKGLEWEVVFLPALEDGLLPYERSAEDPERLAEERRLLYVGITRARRVLGISWAHRRDVGGRARNREASPFLLVAAPDAVRRAELAARPAPGRPRLPRPGSATSRTGRGVADPEVAIDRETPGFRALRAWRLEVARERGVAPFIIAPDRVLDAIVRAAPRSLADLEAIRGVGPRTLEEHGRAILDALESAGPG